MKAYFFALLFAVPLLVLAQPNNEIDASAIKVPGGYAIEAAVTGLSVPTTVTFAGDDLLIAESGFAKTAKPRVLRVKPNGEVTVLASEGLEPPVTGLLVVNNRLYISHKGKVSRLENGGLTDVVTGLPSDGDHQNNNLALGKDGRIYLGQGTVTNSAVVGEDNFVFGWLDKFPNVHDIPCKDVTLAGKNYTTDNPLTEADDKAVTGAYKPFGSSTFAGEVIKGDVKCNGAILSFNPDGSDLRVEAWGLRNPFGLEVDEGGSVWATFHGADVRGSRAIYNDVDYLVKVEKDAWYGWPDYFNGKPVTDASFNAPGSAKPTFLLQNHPPLAQPFLTFDPHAAANGLAFSPGDRFGFKGDAFIAAFGTFTPVTTGPNVELSGFNVLKVDMDTKEIQTFAENKTPGPAYINRQGGFNRPSDVVFGPDESLYVVDWGGVVITEDGLEMQEQTGVVWRIYNISTQRPLFASGPVSVPADPIPEEEHEPLVRTSATSFGEVFSKFWPVILVLLLVIGAIMLIRRRV